MAAEILEKVEQDALRLSKEERAYLADRLLSSLDGESFGDVDASWIEEAERRYAEYKKGNRKPLLASEVFAEADLMLG